MWADRFLRRPPGDVLARAGAAENDGAALDLDLATGPFRIAGLSPDARACEGERYREFVAPSPRQPAPLRVRCARADDFVRVDTRGWTYTLDIDEDDGGLWVAGHGFLARGTVAGDMELCLGFPEQREAAIDNLLRLWIAHRAFDRGGLLLHSAGLVIDGRCVICVGRSGAGKSTLARLVLDAGGEILSDELNVVFPAGEGFRSELLPFAGDVQRDRGHPVRRELPLAAILRLDKGPEHVVCPISPVVLAATLIGAASFVTATPGRAAAVADRCASIASRIPTGTLSFRRDGGVADALATWLGPR